MEPSVGSLDALTGLPNRTGLVAGAAALLCEGHGPVALLILDLDRFKLINDSFGHTHGDRVLLEVANRLRKILPQETIIARPGGDEFILMLATKNASAMAQAVLSAFSRSFAIEGHPYFISGSIGVSMFPSDGYTVEVLMQRADSALYVAKRHGGNTYHFYAAEMQFAASRRLEIENALRRAVEHSEYILYYQPILNGAGALVAAEGLIRWRDPETGKIVLPSEFMPFAEEIAPLVTSLGDWVLEQACRRASEWGRKGYPIKIWVNVSAVQLLQPEFVDRLRKKLLIASIDGMRIGLELTETLLLSNRPEMLTALHELKELGIALALDDFGVAYSSLDYIRRLPIDTIKIDRSFVREIATNRHNQSIVRGVVAIAHELGVEVCAEGVETVSQWQFLMKAGCDYWQGFYYATAEPAHVFAHRLAAAAFTLHRRQA